MKLQIITGLFLFLAASAAMALNCSQCGRKIRGRYLKADGKIYCSKHCYQKKLPKCAKCGKRCTGSYFHKNQQYYCSKNCLNSALPVCAGCGKRFSNGVIVKTYDGDKVFCQTCSRKPKCFSCSLPSDCRRLDDGRNICRNCASTAIFKYDEAQQVFNEVRQLLKSKYNLGTNHKIWFQLVDSSVLKKNSPHYAPGQEFGLFKHSYTIKTVTKVEYSLRGRQENTRKYKTNERSAIMLLYGIPRKKMLEVCAHELGHDWMQVNYPHIRDLKIKEGWAEYVATLANKAYGQENMNRRMRENSDKIYGDGYRMIERYIGQHGADGLKQWFARLNKKP